MSQTEERLFMLMTHAEDLQRVAQRSLQEVGKAVQRMETGTGDALLGVVRAGMGETMREAKKGLTGAAMGLKEASEQAKATSETLKCTGLLLGVFLVAVALVVGGVGFTVMGFIGKSKLAELDELKAAIRAEKSTLDELQSKTWGLELVTVEGKRWIRFKRGDAPGEKVAWENGKRQGIEVKP